MILVNYLFNNWYIHFFRFHQFLDINNVWYWCDSQFIVKRDHRISETAAFILQWKSVVERFQRLKPFRLSRSVPEIRIHTMWKAGYALACISISHWNNWYACSLSTYLARTNSRNQRCNGRWRRWWCEKIEGRRWFLRLSFASIYHWHFVVLCIYHYQGTYLNWPYTTTITIYLDIVVRLYPKTKIQCRQRSHQRELNSKNKSSVLNRILAKCNKSIRKLVSTLN